MRRQYAFRGQTEEKKWVFGSLLRDNSAIWSDGVEIPVLENTVGMFTDKTDKHEKEIFEFDVLAVDIDNDQRLVTFCVIWDEGKYKLFPFYRETWEIDNSFPSCLLEDFPSKKIEVIGTVFDEKREYPNGLFSSALSFESLVKISQEPVLCVNIAEGSTDYGSSEWCIKSFGRGTLGQLPRWDMENYGKGWLAYGLSDKTRRQVMSLVASNLISKEV